MAYIGQSIKNGTFVVLDTSGNTYNGSNTTFSLGTQVGSPAQLLVSHDGVVQKPGTDYTLATGGTQITFTTAPASGASIFIVEISGAVGGPMNTDINGSEFILDVDGDTSITADTDDQIDFKTGGTDRLKVQSTSGNNVVVSDGLTLSDGNITFSGSGHGIHLGVTSATAANLLDDYEEGTFTPTFLGSSADPTVSWNTQSGHYIKVGNVVHLNLTFYPSAISGGSGNLQIGGLPFVNSDSRNHRACGSILYDRVRVQSNTTTVTPEISDNVQYMQISEMREGENETRGFIQVDDLEATSSDNPFIEITITHFTD